MKISIIGSGIVGQSTGLGMLQLGHNVIFYDINSSHLDNLNKQGLEVSGDIVQTIQETDLSFVCVPTPYKEHEGIDLSYIKDAIKGIAKGMENKEYHIVTIKSTVVPCTTENVIKPLLDSYGRNYGLCVNPEFLTEIATTWSDDIKFKRDFWCKERIVIGSNDDSGDILEDIYRPIGANIFRTDLKTAEMSKYATNLILATKISYWNELFLICNKLGIDSHIIAEITSLDARIGVYGTIHGQAFGGKCLPKDLAAFNYFTDNYYAKETHLLEAVEHINKLMANDFGVRE